MNQHRISRRGSASMLFIAPIVYKQEYKLLIFLLSVEWSQILVHVFALNVTFIIDNPSDIDSLGS
jgi:hypothetical protein